MIYVFVFRGNNNKRPTYPATQYLRAAQVKECKNHQKRPPNTTLAHLLYKSRTQGHLYQFNFVKGIYEHGIQVAALFGISQAFAVGGVQRTHTTGPVGDYSVWLPDLHPQ